MLSNDILLLTTLKGGSGGGGGQRELRESSSAIAYKTYCPHNFCQDCLKITAIAKSLIAHYLRSL